MEFKKLIEQKTTISEKINGYFTKAETETRALNAEEQQEVRSLMDQLKEIDDTIKLYNDSQKFKAAPADGAPQNPKANPTEELELRAFANLIRTNKTDYQDPETRAAVNMGTGNNGAIIPRTIAAKIIETVENICPIYRMATHYNVNGELVFPAYDESESKVEMGYKAEFAEAESKVGKFKEITLKGYLAGCLALVSRSLINNVNFDLVGYVVGKVALAITRFFEKEMLLGTGSNAMTGLCVAATQKITAAAADAVTADELIDLQLKVPEIYQGNACWIMNTKTFAAIRKLKDKDGEYLFSHDLVAGFGYVLLGKHVYISDQMPDMATSAKAIAYGDMSGMYVNIHGTMELQVLLERYASQHATGVTCWIEADSNLVEKQKVAVMEMAAA